MSDRTIIQALRDEVQYPVSDGFLHNKLIKRGLSGEEIFTADVSSSKEYQGCVADALIGIITSPNISEGGVSISHSDKSIILNIANTIYRNIGEQEVSEKQEPTVYVGR